LLWDEPKIFFLERRYFFSIILSEFLKNRVALQTSPERPGYRGSAGAKMRQNMKFLRRNLNFAEKTKEESD